MVVKAPKTDDHSYTGNNSDAVNTNEPNIEVEYYNDSF
jgi:hypothetical protein